MPGREVSVARPPRSVTRLTGQNCCAARAVQLPGVPTAGPPVLVGGPPDCPVDNYDVAVSFAGEQRGYVESTVSAARVLGLRVFYDRDMAYRWWGRNFVVEQRRVYVGSTLRFVPFISAEYLARPYPRDEFSYAMLRSVAVGDDYVLPVLFGDVRVPAELLHPHIGYLRAEDHSPRQLAFLIRAKVDAHRAG